MMINFKTGERAKFLSQVAGLSEVIACFVQDLSTLERQKAISSSNDIKVFLARCNTKSVMITRCENNYFGVDSAALIFNKNSYPFEVSEQELEKEWTAITSSWWSKEHFIQLKMATHTKFPGAVARDTELDEAADKWSEESAKEFRLRLDAHEAEIEERINDPAYWEEIRRSLVGIEGR